MLHLLHKTTRPGYPPDYLLPRLRARVDHHTAESRMKEFRDGEIWDAAADARRWLYLQMEESLRASLAPLLFYFELNALVLCLRSMEMGTQEKTVVDLERSLLAEELKSIVRDLGTPAQAVAKVEKYMEGSVVELDGLTAAYNEGGIQKCEQLIRLKFFEQATAACRDRDVEEFLRSLVDQNNTLTMAKCLRWEMREVTALIRGGRIRLLKADRTPSEKRVMDMARHCLGGRNVTAEETAPVLLEPLLFSHMSRSAARQMRSGNPSACCIGYLWLSFARAREQSKELYSIRFTKNFPDVDGRG